MKKLVIASLLCTFSAKAGNLQIVQQVSTLNGTAFGSNYAKTNSFSYVEYALSKKTSVGGGVNVAEIDSQYNGGMKRYALFGPEVLHRYKFLTHSKHGFFVQNSVKMPNIYNENKNLGLMPKQWDYELRAIGLYSSRAFHDSTPYFARYELAYRKRFNNTFDEIRLAFIASVDIGHNLEILLQDNINWNINSTGTSVLNSTYSSFDITKYGSNIATLSLMYHFNRKVALQAGYVQRTGGNNPVHDSDGVIFGVWTAL